MNSDEIGALVWIGLVAAAFVVCYRLTKRIAPCSRLEPRAWLKALLRSFPWAFLFAPSVAFGAIPLPMPAGLLIVAWIWTTVNHVRPVQGPNTATGPFACVALVITWAIIFAVVLFRLRLERKHENKT